MATYYRWRQNEFRSVIGQFGIGIDAIVNSQETKLLLYRLYKAELQTRRAIQAKQDEEDRLANIAYFAWLERHLGESLRLFLKFGNRFPITGWFRKHTFDICFYTTLAYGLMWIVFLH